MFCSDSQRERKEKDVLRNLTPKSINNLSSRNSILTLLVEDLCFWEINAGRNCYGNDVHNLFSAEASRRRGFLYPKNKRRIPTMKEAIDMDKEYDSDNSSESSSFQSTTWKTAIDSESGKIYYYDVVSRKAQWKKV